MPILCALVPHYKVEIARLARPELRERPVLVADRLERGHVIDCDAAARRLGARDGMTLLQASAAVREAALVVDDPTRNRAAWETLLDALDAASPLVEDAGEGTAFLEMRGIEGDPERWRATVREALETPLPFRIAVAPNKFTARVAALAGRAAVAAGEERTFVAPFPLAILAFDPATLQRLTLLGIRTLGELAALPHGPFVRRFGPAAARLHACAQGRDETPLVPRPRALRIDRSLYGEGTAEREEQLLFALRTLVARVSDDLAYAGMRCGFLRLSLECDDGETLEIPASLAQATAQATTLFELLRTRLEGVTLRSPVNGLRLGAERLEAGGSALSLFAGSDPDPEILAIALARIEAALGPQAACHAELQAGNRYETRFRYTPVAGAPAGPGAPAAPAAGESAPAQPGEGPPRTQLPICTLGLRLIEPRPLQVRLARGRPAFVGAQAVLDIAGPWRVSERWWAEPLERDEYDALLADGSLVRIACERGAWVLRGLYD
jgi:protein ImuB